MRTVEQGLTFQEAEEAFARYHVDFTEDKYIALGLRNIHDDQYTNLALILSDQCKHTTKIAVFGDDANTVFKDAKEFGGSVFKQLEESYAYLSLCNRTTAIFKGLERRKIGLSGGSFERSVAECPCSSGLQLQWKHYYQCQ